MLGPISSLFALQQARSAVILGVTQTTERLRSRSAMRPEAARDQLLLVVAQTQSPRPIVGQSQTPSLARVRPPKNWLLPREAKSDCDQSRTDVSFEKRTTIVHALDRPTPLLT